MYACTHERTHVYTQNMSVHMYEMYACMQIW